MELKDIKQDGRNYRIHNDKNLSLIKKSITEVGFGRSIVIDSENEIIAGNGVASQVDENTKIKVVETDGSELVVVKRTDLKTDDEKRKKLAIMDNSSSDSSSFDYDILSADFSPEELVSMGVEVSEIEDIEKEIAGDELKKELGDLRGLIYEKQGDKPNINDLYSEDGVDEFRVKIENSNATQEEKEFLQKALTRFYKFNFKNIAEYYCHSSDDVKQLFAELLLVIPDGKRLLRNRLLKLDSLISEDFDD